MINHSAHCGTHTLAARGSDMYETPPCAVRSLLEVETLPSGAVWEPACGRGNILRVCSTSSAIAPTPPTCNDYGTPEQDAAGIDFLWATGSVPCFIGSIVTNPPYRLAGEFVCHALTICPRVCMLLRLAFLESERR
jgi:hypothetical protein